MTVDRSVAISNLRESVDAFAGFVESRPDPPLTGGAWGAREVLCHIVYWHETYVRILRAINAGGAPVQREGRFTEFNRQAVVELGAVPAPELVARLRRAQRRLEVELLALTPTAHINIKVGSKPWGANQFPERIAGHLRGHLRELRRAERRQAA